MGVSSALGVSALFPAGFGFRNVLINGDMQVAQRGTSTASITTNGYYTADRWAIFAATLGTWTQSVENDAPTGSGFRKSLKMLCTTADASPASGDNMRIAQSLEGQNIQQFLKGTSNAKHFALSFWVKSNVTGTYICNLIDANNIRSVSAAYTINASGVWEKKTVTFPPDAVGQFNNDNAVSLRVFWWLGAGSSTQSGTLNTVWETQTEANRAVGQVNLAAATNNYWQITGVQLEANVQPTPFEHRPIGVELALCQRYFTKSFPIATTPVSPGGTGAGSGNQLCTWATTLGNAYSAQITFKTTMRRTPDITFYNAQNANNNTWSIYSSSAELNSSYSVSVGMASESHFFGYIGGVPTVTISNGHWTANAEL